MISVVKTGIKREIQCTFTKEEAHALHIYMRGDSSSPLFSKGGELYRMLYDAFDKLAKERISMASSPDNPIKRTPRLPKRSG